jgi:hypothetical protein
MSHPRVSDELSLRRVHDQFCPACQMEVLYLGEAQMDRCWNCGTRLQALKGSASRKRAKQRLPLARFLVALLVQPDRIADLVLL